MLGVPPLESESDDGFRASPTAGLNDAVIVPGPVTVATVEAEVGEEIVMLDAPTLQPENA